MSLVTQAIIAETYGLRLNMEQLAHALGIARQTVYNKIAAGTFEIPTYVDGTRWCDYRDVSTYLDACRARAEIPA